MRNRRRARLSPVRLPGIISGVRFLLMLISMLAVVEVAATELPARLHSPPCIACDVDAAHLRRAYSDEQWRSIERGEVVTVDLPSPGARDAEERRVQASAIFPKPPEKVWSVLADLPSRPNYLPDVEAMRIVRIDGKRVWVDESLNFFLFNVRNKVVNVFEPRIGSISWALDETADNDIDENTGAWQLAPLREGAHTLVIYRVYVDSGQAVPGFVERYLVETSVPKLLERIRDEVVRRFPSEPSR